MRFVFLLTGFVSRVLPPCFSSLSRTWLVVLTALFFIRASIVGSRSYWPHVIGEFVLPILFSVSWPSWFGSLTFLPADYSSRMLPCFFLLLLLSQLLGSNALLLTKVSIRMAIKIIFVFRLFTRRYWSNGTGRQVSCMAGLGS